MGKDQKLQYNQLFGLLGKHIDYSFSRGYFSAKFEREKIADAAYINFDIEQIEDFSEILATHTNLKGLNVTIPYKQAVIPYLDALDDAVLQVGAVNTIAISKSGQLTGFNTDVIGFEASLRPLLYPHHTKALILGTGGASKAVAFVLESLGIAYQWVSRNPNSNDEISYERLTHDLIAQHNIIINCSPVGTYPNVHHAPQLPYEAITSSHLLYDLIYNPEETLFLQKGKEQGAQIKNGYEMLVLQAEASWDIWNTHPAS